MAAFSGRFIGLIYPTKSLKNEKDTETIGQLEE